MSTTFLKSEPLSEKEAAAYSPNVLAFYGDSVYETLVRENIVRNHQTNAGKLHELAVKRVRASFQSEAVNIVGEHAHAIRKLSHIGFYGGWGGSSPKETVVNVHKRISGILKPQRIKQESLTADDLFVDMHFECIPRTPSHHWLG